ncbi:hypothetical protein C0995_009771 [Termitomyces sp. Mi166|nr:hypothetical protein C0995_009771 [Termitomyces sp. Mi166\
MLQRDNDVSSERNREDAIGSAVKLLLDGMDYHRPDSNEERKASLAQVLSLDFSMYEVDHEWFQKACLHAAMLAEFPSSMEKFQVSILSSENIDQAVLKEFRNNLCGMYPLWDPISANCIVSSAMEYINGCLLENLQTAQEIEIHSNAQSWPYYLREKTGVAAAYAFMIFPRSSSYNLTDFVQVIGDIMVYINLANDVLSFYKEEMQNETGNYVHNRARVHGQSTNDTLLDVSRDTLAAYLRVCKVLKSHSPTTYELWKTFAHGYISCHVDVPRYRLKELGI